MAEGQRFSEIFEAMVQDHAARPRNIGAKIEAPDLEADGLNPMTGDQIRVQIQLGEAGVFDRVEFSGQGSALMMASASIMTGALVGLTSELAETKVAAVLAGLQGGPFPENESEEELTLLMEVHQFPHRFPCAALAWKTCQQALGGNLNSQVGAE